VLHHQNSKNGDFVRDIAEFGFGPTTVRALSDNPNDQTGMPKGFVPKFEIGPSRIEGRGVICSHPIKRGEVIGPSQIGGKRTPLGRFANHSRRPNARMVLVQNGDVDLIANRPIGVGEEVTVDYRQVARDIQKLPLGQSD
jgi:hypothetical protein